MGRTKFHYKYPHLKCLYRLRDFRIRRNTTEHPSGGERGIEPFKGRWAFPGGFLKMDETALRGAKRELFEGTGLKDTYIHRFHAFSGVDPTLAGESSPSPISPWYASAR